MTPPFVPADELPARDPYYTDFAIEYDQHTNGVRGDIDFYREIALSADGPVVELGVGTGRTAIPAALGGADVLGLDLSPEMLALCRSKAADGGVSTLSLAVADMRRFALAKPVNLITIPHRAFLHNLTMEDQLATLASCRGALRTGGRLALNVFNPDLAKMVEWMLRGPEEWEEREVGPPGAVHRNDYDPSDQRCDSTIMLPGPDGMRRRVTIHLRYVYRAELEHLLARSGFEVETVYGDFFGAPFGPLSNEIVCLARAI
jgi:SAM-dependent methyltransferase